MSWFAGTPRSSNGSTTSFRTRGTSSGSWRSTLGSCSSRPQAHRAAGTTVVRAKQIHSSAASQPEVEIAAICHGRPCPHDRRRVYLGRCASPTGSVTARTLRTSVRWKSRACTLPYWSAARRAYVKMLQLGLLHCYSRPGQETSRHGLCRQRSKVRPVRRGGFQRSSQRGPLERGSRMSSRRVPKGPGRRPMSQKRREFLELLAKGWSLSGACRELGIGRSTGHIWKNGTVVRHKDGNAKSRATTRATRCPRHLPRFLSEQERIQIADLASRGHGPTAIGQALGRSPSTISRELRPNLHTSGQYRPFHVHALAATRRRRTHPLKRGGDPVSVLAGS